MWFFLYNEEIVKHSKIKRQLATREIESAEYKSNDRYLI